MPHHRLSGTYRQLRANRHLPGRQLVMIPARAFVPRQHWTVTRARRVWLVMLGLTWAAATLGVLAQGFDVGTIPASLLIAASIVLFDWRARRFLGTSKRVEEE